MKLRSAKKVFISHERYRDITVGRALKRMRKTRSYKEHESYWKWLMNMLGFERRNESFTKEKQDGSSEMQMREVEAREGL